MKKLICSVLSICIISAFSLTDVRASNSPSTNGVPTEAPIPAEVQTMINRVYEIQDMDRSQMTIAERKELKQELRTIKSEMKAVSGVYLSIGAIIIIIILLLLLL
ncbi:MAG: hypothetical protein M3R25_12735 [Bacteroidota bacterium]|nr:hypothetical protein [Bacteroidota bacterium]